MGTGLLTGQGLDIKRLDDILKDLESDFRAQFGQNVNLDPDSELGKLMAIFAKWLSDLWELTQSVYNSQYPGTASGYSLDRIGEITNITRNPALPSTVDLFVRGNSVTVPANSLVAVQDTTKRFRTLSVIEIPPAADLTDMTGSGKSIVRSGGTVTVTYPGHGKATGSYIWITGADQPEYNGVHQITVTDSDHFTFQISGTPVSPATGDVTGYSAFKVKAESVERGPISAGAGTLTEIITTISGWDAVTNPSDAVLGRNRETDEEFRARRIAVLQGFGNATISAIQGDVLMVDGVSLCRVFENDSGVTDSEGRPPHSVEVLVNGGADLDIAKAILESKAAGIQTHGSTSQVVNDSQGTPHTIYFSRPAAVLIYLDVILVVNSEFPAGGAQTVKDALLAWGLSFTVGQDVIVHPYLEGAIADVPGIVDVTVNIGTSPSPSGDANIAIGQTQYASFDASRITVTV